jgi:hypothetical protein
MTEKQGSSPFPPSARVVAFEKFFYSRYEAASSLAMSVRAIDYLISDGKLRYRRASGELTPSPRPLRAVPGISPGTGRRGGLKIKLSY